MLQYTTLKIGFVLETSKHRIYLDKHKFGNTFKNHTVESTPTYLISSNLVKMFKPLRYSDRRICDQGLEIHSQLLWTNSSYAIVIEPVEGYVRWEVEKLNPI